MSDDFFDIVGTEPTDRNLCEECGEHCTMAKWEAATQKTKEMSQEIKSKVKDLLDNSKPSGSPMDVERAMNAVFKNFLGNCPYTIHPPSDMCEYKKIALRYQSHR